MFGRVSLYGKELSFFAIGIAKVVELTHIEVRFNIVRFVTATDVRLCV